ncbi:DUF5610 domain-containing protein [Psychrosphaera sp. B3R10]|uniref:DUF5610 domain-containing protein n=1 Tax=unclassified Psychrosphaera TaxID=2641570 RepID=UPI001C08FCE0|nr:MULTISPECIES: DUF5610 domain-containing protein [unclassified Psychrosphaera]MBU2880613.1 DUF5610 domain-containing protein [Psychrosphaera sp. I2R16]MBU2990699.1 DUF5610 domain-containing protein [Psychrosphaera sp. B3R10]MDO6720820.1 DUF5610 domain-containing protein [Psychrosphaera sp. 1_MG-2023]
MIRLDTNLMSNLGPSSSNNKTRSMEESSSTGVKAHEQITFYQYNSSDKKSFSMFQQTVHRRLEDSLQAKFPSANSSLEELEVKEREERANLAANNILKFVELRLKHDVADGATSEQLESRLKAALEGFEKGYDEANDVLKDMNLLSPEVDEDISLTKEKVLAGLELLKEKYLPETAVENSDNDVNDLANSAVSSNDVVAKASKSEVRQNIGKTLAEYSAVQVGEARDFSFELQTKDGDVVTINASSLMAYQAESASGSTKTQFGESQLNYLSADSLEENNFAFSVTGELDDDELKAINDILNSVNDLATDFYGGDVNKAFEKAMNMGFDSNEISSFAFSMTRVRSVKAIQAYQPEQEILKPSVLSELKPIGKFASELARSLTIAKEHFTHPQQLISSILEQVDLPDSSGNEASNSDGKGKMSFFEFAQSLLEKFDELDAMTAMPDAKGKETGL